VSVASNAPAVAVRDLRKEFGDGPVLDGVDLTVPDGEITLLLGPNGVGKTILLSCIAGGLAADAGDVAVFGRPPDEAGDALSFALQGGMLVDELTGRENVAFFRDLHPRATDRWREILDELAFDADALDREVSDYSGGMRRKLELAIGLSVEVPLYLLDEPTAALDMTTVETLHSLLSERADDGDTVLLTSHLPVDADLADRIAVVTESGIVAQGPPAALLADVPQVVRAEGVGAGLDEYVREGRLFETDRERRGFLRADVDPASVEAAVDGPGSDVGVTDPTVTDLFDYYVHVARPD